MLAKTAALKRDDGSGQCPRACRGQEEAATAYQTLWRERKKTQSMVEGALVEEESKTAGAARDAAEGAR